MEKIATPHIIASKEDFGKTVLMPGDPLRSKFIAENFLEILKYEAFISGAMARIPVPGTPLGEIEKISDKRIAQIIAVLRLSGGNIVKDICVHPVTLEALKSGANVMVVETGAIPRDTACEKESWNGVDMQRANELLKEAGYKVEKK